MQALPLSRDLTKNEDWMTEEMETGTTIIAVQYDGGVVMGADSRATTGSYIANRVADKIQPVHKRIFCCRSGSSADTQFVADYVRYFLQMHSTELDDFPSVQTAANLFRELCYTNKSFLLASIICAGWDPTRGGSVYSIPLSGSLVKQPFAIGGSGSTYIYGFCDSEFREGMSKDECVKFVIRAVSLAMARDGSSGGIIRYAIIDENGVDKQKVLPDEFPQQYRD